VAVIQRLLAIIARAGGKIKGVFGIWEDVAKDALRVVGAVGELSRVGQAAWDGGVRDGVIGAEGLGGHGGEGTPRVELAVAPVDVAGADGPAAEAGVEAVDVWGCGEEGYGGVGELGLAHLEGGGEGVVFGGDLVGAKVCGLEIAEFGAGLPGPGDVVGILDQAVTSPTGAVRTGAVRGPAVGRPLGAFLLGPAVAAGGLVGIGIGADVVAKAADSGGVSAGVTLKSVVLEIPGDIGGERACQTVIGAVAVALAQERLLERCNVPASLGGIVADMVWATVEDLVDVVDCGVDILGAVAKAVGNHAAINLVVV